MGFLMHLLSLLPLITHAVQRAEDTAQTGPEKKQVALDIIRDGVSAAGTFTDAHLDAITDAASPVIDAIVAADKAIKSVADSTTTTTTVLAIPTTPAPTAPTVALTAKS